MADLLTEVIILPPFDYASIEPGLAKEAKAKAEAIRTRLRDSWIATGHDLLTMKEKLGHGRFGAWIAAELDMTARHAERLMAAAKWAKANPTLMSEMPPTTAFLLSAKSTPDPVRNVVMKKIEAGERVPAASIKALVAEAREAAKEAAKPPEQKRRERRTKARREAEQIAWRKEEEAREQRRDAAIAAVLDLLTKRLARDEIEFVLAEMEEGRVHPRHIQDALKTNAAP